MPNGMIYPTTTHPSRQKLQLNLKRNKTHETFLQQRTTDLSGRQFP